MLPGVCTLKVFSTGEEADYNLPVYKNVYDESRNTYIIHSTCRI